MLFVHSLLLAPGIWEARNCCHILYTINIILGWVGLAGWEVVEWGWGGVGWANNVHVTVGTFAVAHICHAMLLFVLLHLHSYTSCYACYLALSPIRRDTLLYVSCACSHTSCHASAHSACYAILNVLVRLRTYVMLCYCTFSCTFTRTSWHCMH